MRISDQGHGWRPPWGAAPNGRREDLRMRASGIAMFVAGALWLAPMAVAAQTQSGTVTPAAPPAAAATAETAPADTGGQQALTPAPVGAPEAMAQRKQRGLREIGHT